MVPFSIIFVGEFCVTIYTRWYSNQGGSRKEGQGQECVGGVERVE